VELRMRRVVCRYRILFRSIVVHIGHDADDLPLAGTRPEALSERVLSGIHVPRHRLVQDRDARCALTIALIEVASTYRYTERLEPAGRREHESAGRCGESGHR